MSTFTTQESKLRYEVLTSCLCVQDIMSPLQEESGCDEDEGEDEEEGREEDEEFDSDESLVDSDSDSDEKGDVCFLTASP